MTRPAVQSSALTWWFGVVTVFLGLGLPINVLGAQNVTLAWDSNSEPDVIGYKLHHGETSRVYTQVLDVGNGTNATVAALVEGNTYFFAVSAYNTSGIESDLSNEVQYTVPTPGNSPPIANESSVSLPEDQSVAVLLSASDADGNPLSYSTVTAPVHGLLSGQAPNLIYTPQSDFFGEDRFTFTVNDGFVDSTAATVSITVTPVDDPPVARSFAVATAQDTPVQVVLSGMDPDGSFLTYSFGNPTSGTLGGASPNLTYTPDPGFAGVDSFAFVANDGLTESDTATVSITVVSADLVPNITSVRATDSGVQITWDVIVGKTYRVLCKDSLDIATWTSVGEGFLAGGSQLYWVDTDTFTTTGRFYIVELVDP